MSSRIAVDIGKVQQLATSLDGLAQQVEALRTNLGAAVRPAQRGDVPELPSITAQFMIADTTLRSLGADVRGRSSMVRGYALSMARVEAMLAIYRYQLRLQGMASLGWNPLGHPAGTPAALRGPAADELRNALLNVAVGYGIERLPGLPRLADGTLDLTKGVGFLAAKGIVVKSAWNVWTMGSGLGTALSSDKDPVTRIGGGLDFLAGGAASGTVALEVLGLGGTAAHGALAASAPWLGTAAAGWTIGNAIGTHQRQGFEADDAAGRSSLQRINQTTLDRMQQFGPAGTPLVAAEAGLNYSTLGVYKGSQAVARHFYPEAPQPDEIDATRQAQLLAAVRQLHPDAQVVPLDGRFIVKVPNGAAVDSFFIDNTKLTIQ